MGPLDPQEDIDKAVRLIYGAQMEINRTYRAEEEKGMPDDPDDELQDLARRAYEAYSEKYEEQRHCRPALWKSIPGKHVGLEDIGHEARMSWRAAVEWVRLLYVRPGSTGPGDAPEDDSDAD